MGSGRPLQMISRLPIGQPPKTSLVRLAPQAPSRISQSTSAAGAQPAGTCSTRWIAWVIALPTE